MKVKACPTLCEWRWLHGAGIIFLALFGPLGSHEHFLNTYLSTFDHGHVFMTTACLSSDGYYTMSCHFGPKSLMVFDTLFYN